MSSCDDTLSVIRELGSERVLCCTADGPIIDSDQHAVDLVGDAMAAQASMIAIPVSRLGAAFFQLRSGVAGTVVQKIVTYRIKLAIVGDITEPLTASGALRDWVYECNRGNEVCFVPSLDALATRLGDAAFPR